MDSVWYYVRNGSQAGPVSFDELRAAAASGQLAATDLVWKEGTADWVAARTVPGLIAASPPPVPAGAPAATGTGPAPLSLDGPPGGGKAAELFALAQVFVRRAAAPNPAAVRPTPAEEEELTRAGITDPVARKFAAWRRAVLWVSVVPSGFAALFGLVTAVSMKKEDTEYLSNFGVLLIFLQAFALFALPAAAVLAATSYQRFAASARWVLIGGAVSLAVPLVIAFVPGEMLLELKGASRQEAAMMRGVMGLALGVQFYMILMPSVLSLLPAVSRACVRVKTFLPESLVPGWGLVASVPLFALLTLATFVLLYHVAGNVLLVGGLLLWIGAPLLYLSRFELLTRPVTDRRELEALARTQLVILGMVAAGVLLLTVYLFTAKFFEMTLVGTDEKTSLMRPWSLDLHRKWIEFVGRSLFLTVLFADLLTRMALSVWREESKFAGTEGAAKFGKTMTGLADAIEPRRAAGP